MKKTKLSDYPEWQQENEKLQELRLERDSLDRAYNEGLSKLSEHDIANDKLTAAAERLLAGDQRIEEKTFTSKDLENLSNKRRVIRRAIEIQEKRVRALETKLSQEICKKLKPHYVAIVKEMAKAAAKLQDAAEKERLFREDMRDGGISFTAHIPPMGLRSFGMKDDQYSIPNRFFRNAVEAGYLRQSEIEVIK